MEVNSMTIKLSLIGGGQDQAETKTLLGEIIISSGVTGTIETLTPPSGFRVIIDTLAAVSSIEANISIEIGGVDIITNKSLSQLNANTNGDFCIGMPTLAGGGGRGGGYSPIIGGIDEVILIKKSSGNTTTDIEYAAKYTK